ncbi:MAG TPA: transposase [Clostridia bacterium]|nr:transposase [Clostridia bacterium]
MRKCSLYPTDLTDAQWHILERLLPKAKKRRRRPTDRRRILNGLFYFVRAGCAWRLLPKEYGPWETVYGYFRRWRQCGLWNPVHEVLRRLVRGQPATLVVVKAGLFAKLFFEDPDLLLEVFNHVLLAPVHPTGQAQEQQLQRIHGQRMQGKPLLWPATLPCPV